MCFRPHESAAVFPRQMPSTLSPLCPPKTTDTPSHSSTPHKKTPVSPPHSGWNSQTDLFRHFFSAAFPQHKPNEIVPTAADLIHSDLTENPVGPATLPSAGSTVQSLWFDLRLPLEFPKLPELRLCRSLHQDPGSTSSARVKEVIQLKDQWCERRDWNPLTRPPFTVESSPLSP